MALNHKDRHTIERSPSLYIWCLPLTLSLSFLFYKHDRYPLSTLSSPAHTTCGSIKPLCKYQTQIPKAHSAIGPTCVMDHPLSNLLHPRAGLDSTAWPSRSFSKLVSLLPPEQPLLTSLVVCVALSVSQVQD